MKVGELSARIRLDGKPDFDRGVDDAGRRFQNLGTRAKDVGQNMATTLVAATGTMAGLGIAAFKTGVEYNALQQSSRAALETLLGSAEAANAQMDKLDEFASNSPFAKDVFIRAQQQMIGFGIAAEDVVPILGAVQDATAAVGGSNQDISDIVTTLSKISSTGKITAQDLNELGNKGIDAAGLIGKEFGKTGGEIRDMISKGQITADEAIDAITGQMSEQFGGAAANVKETWVGAVDRIKAAWRDTGAALAAPFVDPNGGGKAITWANDFADVLRAVQKQVEPLMGVVVDRWGKDLDKISPYLQDLKARIDSLDMSALNESLDALDGYGPIIAGLAASFTAWGTAALPIIGGINPLVAGVTALVMATPELRDGLGGVLTAAAPLVDMMGDLGVQVADLAMHVLNTVAPAFIDLAEAVVDASIPLAGTMTDAISGLITIAEPLVSVLADVIGWMSELPDEVLLAGTAFFLLKDKMSPLVGAFDKVITSSKNVASHLTAAGDSGGVFIVGADGATTSTGRLGAAMNVASGQIARAGTALKTAFMTNAPALAIAGLVSILGHFSSQSAEAEALVQRLADSLDEVTGAATDATRALVAEDLTALDEWEQMKRIAEENGFAISTYTDYVLGNAEAQRIVEDAMAGVRREYDGAPGARYKTAESGDYLIGKLEEEGDAFIKAGDLVADHNALVGKTDGVEKQTEAQERLTEILGGQTQAIESLIDARRREQGEAATYADAQVKHANAVETMQRAIEDESIALDKSTGKWNAYTDAGQTAIQGSKETLDSMLTMAEALAQTADGVDDILPGLNDMYEGWIDQTVAMGATREQAEALAAEYGLFPEQIATEAYLDATKAELDLADLLIEIDEAEGTVTIAGERAPLDATLGEVIGDVDEASGTVDINGNRIPADMTVGELLAYIDASEEDVKVNADDTKGQGVLKSFEGDVRGAEEFAKINATDDRAMDVLGRAESKIRNTQANMRIGANPSSLNDWVARWSGKVLGTSYWNVQARRGPLLQQMLGNADGSILEFYAGGGLRENHVAQIAPAGAWRVWAEPETGGEAYIPLAESKRARSEQILAETADRFNLMVVPKDTGMYADGGGPGGRARYASRNGFPTSLVLQVGEREFTAFVKEKAGEIPEMRIVNEFVTAGPRHRKAGQ